MDQIDRIDKMKKESYLSLIDSSKKIIENINSEILQIPLEIKEQIIENVQEIIDLNQENRFLLYKEIEQKLDIYFHLEYL